MLRQINGLKVIESLAATEPKMVLSKDLMVTEEFRTSQNQWLEQFSGRVPAAYMLGPDTMVVHPQLAHKLGAYK